MKLPNQVLGFILTIPFILSGCSGTDSSEQTVQEEDPTSESTQSSTSGKLGDKAGSLDTLTMVKGNPVSIEPGKFYIIEFWATWCGPCKTSMPHLTEIYKEYKGKGVTVIGVSNEPVDTIEPFVEENSETMDYLVASDSEGLVSDSYMKAFERTGIPSAFIVDDNSNVVWVGHPLDGMDESLDQILAGTYDMAEYARLMAEKKKEAEKAALEFQKRMEEWQAKIDGISQKIEEDPENTELLLERIELYLGDSFTTDLAYNPRHLDLALEDYQRILDLDPEDTHQAAENVAFFEAWQDQTDQRKEKLSAFAEQYPESIRIPFAMYYLFYEANERGDTEQALECLTKAASANLESRFGEFLSETLEKMKAEAESE